MPTNVVKDLTSLLRFFHLNLITPHGLYMAHYCLVPGGYNDMFTYMGF